MTQDEIIRMAREAGLVDMRNWLNVYADSYHLERFAALVAAHERQKFMDLTDDEIRAIRFNWERNEFAIDFARAVIEKFKEKNK